MLTHASRLELRPSLLARLAALIVLALPLVGAVYAGAYGHWLSMFLALLLAAFWLFAYWRHEPLTALWLDEQALLAVEWRGHYWPVSAATQARRLGWLLWWPLCWHDNPPPAGAPKRVVLWSDAFTQQQWRLAQRLALRLSRVEQAAAGASWGPKPEP